MSHPRDVSWRGGVCDPPLLPPPGCYFVEPDDALDFIGIKCASGNAGRPVTFSLVPTMIGKRRKPTSSDPAIFADWPDEKHDEGVLRLRFSCETRCALNQDPEAGACDLRCPECGARGAWAEGATGDHLCEPDASQVDLEPYKGRKRVPDESPAVWRCNRGHETKEPLRPKKEPRSGGGRTKAPSFGRNATEDRLILLCASTA